MLITTGVSTPVHLERVLNLLFFIPDVIMETGELSNSLLYRDGKAVPSKVASSHILMTFKQRPRKIW